LGSTPSKNSKSKCESNIGTVSLVVDSTKVLPRQILMPPRKGEKE